MSYDPKHWFFAACRKSTAALAMLVAINFSAADNHAYAQGNPSRHTNAILTVTGDIKFPKGAVARRFNLRQLASLPRTTFRTNTLWTDGIIKFTGVHLRDLLTHVNATGDQIKLTALNDYSVIIPRDSIDDEGPVLAYLINDKPLPVRRFGPLWLVYPYDADPKYRSDTYYARSIWQIRHIYIFGQTEPPPDQDTAPSP